MHLAHTSQRSNMQVLHHGPKRNDTRHAKRQKHSAQTETRASKAIAIRCPVSSCITVIRAARIQRGGGVVVRCMIKVPVYSCRAPQLHIHLTSPGPLAALSGVSPFTAVEARACFLSLLFERARAEPRRFACFARHFGAESETRRTGEQSSLRKKPTFHLTITAHQP